MFSSGKLILILVLFVVSLACTWHAAMHFERAKTWQGKVGAVVGIFVFDGIMFFLIANVVNSSLP